MGQAFFIMGHTRHPGQPDHPHVFHSAATNEHHPDMSRKKSFYLLQHPIVLKEDEQLVKEYGSHHWRVAGYRFLHKHWVILALALLMVIDIIFMMVDLVLAAFYPQCGTILELSKCSAHANDSAILFNNAFDSSGNQCRQECVEEPGAIENAKVGFTVASLIILLIFLLELLFHLAIVGFRRFFSNWFLLVDLSIVLISIGLEVYLLVQELSNRGNGNDPALEASTVPIIIVARSWRLLRISHSTYKEAHDWYGERIRTMQEELASLRDKLALAEQRGFFVNESKARSASSSSSLDDKVRVPRHAITIS